MVVLDKFQTELTIQNNIYHWEDFHLLRDVFLIVEKDNLTTE